MRKKYGLSFGAKTEMKEKHKHLLKQRNILDGSILKCNCGLTFIWNPLKFEYEEGVEK